MRESTEIPKDFVYSVLSKTQKVFGNKPHPRPLPVVGWSFLKTFDTLLNNHLWNYLWIRVYDPWLGTEVNTKLQTALKQPLRALAEQVITELDSLGPATWDAALTTNITKRESLFNSLKQSLELAKRTGNATERNQYYTWLKGLINRYPTYFKQPADLGNYYILANLRLFLTVGLVVISPEPLTATGKNDIAATAGLTSRYLTIWNRHQVIIGDNNRTTTPNLITMEAYLSKLPPGYHNLQLITVGDDFDRTDSANFGPLGGFGAVGRAVNIWVSTNPYSQWPLNEVPAHNSIDTLHLMAHEVGHRVGALRERGVGQGRAVGAHQVGAAVGGKAAARQADVAHHGGQAHAGPEGLLAMIGALQRPGHVHQRAAAVSL